jgi:hypothetical protein
MKVFRFYFDHIFEADFSLIYASEELNSDGNFEGAGHGESLIAVDRYLSSRLKMNRSRADHSASDAGESRHLAFEPFKRGVATLSQSGCVKRKKGEA